MKIFLACLALAFSFLMIFQSVVYSQTAEPKLVSGSGENLFLGQGDALTLRTDADLKNIYISNPSVVDVKVIDIRSFTVIPAQRGQADITVDFVGRDKSAVYAVTVTAAKNTNVIVHRLGLLSDYSCPYGICGFNASEVRQAFASSGISTGVETEIATRASVNDKAECERQKLQADRLRLKLEVADNMNAGEGSGTFDELMRKKLDLIKQEIELLDDCKGASQAGAATADVVSTTIGTVPTMNASACGQAQGLCIAQCNGDGQCIGRCTAQQGFCTGQVSAMSNMAPPEAKASCSSFCAASQGRCIAQCNGDGQCIGQCASALGQCQASC